MNEVSAGYMQHSLSFCSISFCLPRKLPFNQHGYKISPPWGNSLGYSWVIVASYLLSAEQDVCKVFPHFSRAMQTHSPGVVNDTGNSQERCWPSQGCHNPWNTQKFLRKHQNQGSSLKLKAKPRSLCNFQLFFPNSCAEKCFAGP